MKKRPSKSKRNPASRRGANAGAATKSGAKRRPQKAAPLTAAASGPIRVLIAKPGLDGHDRGAKVVARALRDAGMEVIYTGLHQTPEMIVRSAIQEDVECIGLSILSGAHMTLFPEVLRLLKAAGMKDVVVFGGGIVPNADVQRLKKLGIREIFQPGASTKSIVEWVRATLRESGRR